MAKTLYHSELCTLGDVLVTVTTDVMSSKFSKPGAPKPNWVGLKIDGEERTYNLDSDACEAFFSGRKGQTLTIQAFGSKDEAVVVESGKPVPADHEPEPPAFPSKTQAPVGQPPGRAPVLAQSSGEAPAAQARASGGPAAGRGLEDLTAARQIIGKAGNLWGLAAKALHHQLTVLNGNPETAWIAGAICGDGQATQAAIATLCIQADRMGAVAKLPAGDSAHGARTGAA